MERLRPFEFRDLELPEVDPDGLIVRVTLANICGSGVHAWEGRTAAATTCSRCRRPCRTRPCPHQLRPGPGGLRAPTGGRPVGRPRGHPGGRGAGIYACAVAKEMGCARERKVRRAALAINPS